MEKSDVDSHGASVLALHGFLGLPSDWQDAAVALNLPFHALDLNELKVIAGKDPFLQAAEWINREGHKRSCNILLGYSLGARLALHAFALDPARWQKVILISCNPGLATPQERAERVSSDEKWAKRFASLEIWSRLIFDWNAQPVFKSSNSYEPVRKESDFDRDQLAATLRLFSLGHQNTWQISKLADLEKLYWVTGSLDQKFDAIAKANVPPSNHHSVPGGHRLIFSNPDFNSWLANILQ